MTFLYSISRRMVKWWTWTMSSTVTFIRCRLKTRSTFLVKFPQQRGMQIPLNSHEHGETLKAFYGMPSLRLNSWSESWSATIFSSMGRYYETTFRAGYIYTPRLRIFNPFLRGYVRHVQIYIYRVKNICTHECVVKSDTFFTFPWKTKLFFYLIQ